MTCPNCHSSDVLILRDGPAPILVCLECGTVTTPAAAEVAVVLPEHAHRQEFTS